MLKKFHNSTLKIFLFCSIGFVALAENNEIHHPAPKDPLYLSKDLYVSVKNSLKAIPKEGSQEFFQDLGELLFVQNKRTAEACAQATREAKVSIDSFYGGTNAILSEEEMKILEPIFQQIRNDADFFIQKLKIELPRLRPFKYIPEIKPCVPLEVSMAYPSGHATLARLYAHLFSDKFPNRKKEFFERANEIGDHRVLAGVHHRSDVLAGQELGDRLYKEFKKSKRFQDDLKNGIR